MSPAPAVRIGAATAADTEALGARFAQTRPRATDGALLIYLRGPLGAGKTTWARGFLQAYGVDRVRSPTYTLLETYTLPGIAVAHVDLFRLTQASEVEQLGLRDLDTPAHLWLVEWPERAGQALPPPDLEVRLETAGTARVITVTAPSPLGERWLRAAEGLPAAAGAGPEPAGQL